QRLLSGQLSMRIGIIYRRQRNYLISRRSLRIQIANVVSLTTDIIWILPSSGKLHSPALP
ncbi:hypothetical protein, partial [Alteromonas macleodii]|uniref:hypothetical protein n=1 Tax=Alteromonas macleodii TaxID=28108 RepID=UPI001E638682